MNVNKKYQLERRRELRKNQTEAERILWDKLRNRKFMKLKFRRQYGIGDYIVDFYCSKLRIAIELDGEIHDSIEAKQYDKIRDELIKKLNITIIRFKNREIFEELDLVLKKIKEKIEKELEMKSILKCPVCGEELNKIEKTYRCKNNHTFDMGKQGYVNLHMSNEKRSKNPGDDKNMIISRKNFLEKGYYKKISESLNKIILNEIEGKNKINILDIGCGEGYYTNLLKEKLDDTNIENHIVGIDISKDGIIVAARNYKTIEWIVASGSKLPIKSDSLDYIICMFSYIDPKEYKRVLKKGGKLITVSTGEYHLVEIKEVVYDKLKMDYYRPIEDVKDGYIHKKLENIKYKIKIETNEDIKSLFDMTPYRWKSPKDGVERLFKLEELEITVDVNIDVFEKN